MIDVKAKVFFQSQNTKYVLKFIPKKFHKLKIQKFRKNNKGFLIKEENDKKPINILFKNFQFNYKKFN